MKEILEKLNKIQNELKAPKAQRNLFGNYDYRSCEDILEAVKPLCAKNRAVLILSDEVYEVNNRNYVQATAALYDLDTNLSIQSQASAREEETKKGMDGSQITGAASSYARKYALNGLFCIDDTKDSDVTNKGDEISKSKANNKTNISKVERELRNYVKSKNVEFSIIEKYLKKHQISDIEALDEEKINYIKSLIDKTVQAQQPETPEKLSWEEEE